MTTKTKEQRRNKRRPGTTGKGSCPGGKRSEIRPGLRVEIVLKKDQGTGKRNEGVVKDILTRSANHPHGIKVRLQDGKVGRVKKIIGPGSGR